MKARNHIRTEILARQADRQAARSALLWIRDLAPCMGVREAIMMMRATTKLGSKEQKLYCDRYAILGAVVETTAEESTLLERDLTTYASEREIGTSDGVFIPLTPRLSPTPIAARG